MHACTFSWSPIGFHGCMDVYHYPPNSLDRLMVRYHCLSMTLDGWIDGWMDVVLNKPNGCDGCILSPSIQRPYIHPCYLFSLKYDMYIVDPIIIHQSHWVGLMDGLPIYWMDGWMDGLCQYPPNSFDSLMVRYHYLSMILDGWMDGSSTGYNKWIVIDVDFHHPSNAHISIRVIYPPLRTTCTSDTLHYPSITLDWLDEWVTNILDAWMDGCMDGWTVSLSTQSLDSLMVRYHYLSMTLDGWMDASTKNWIK